jgi:hypothetical protein
MNVSDEPAVPFGELAKSSSAGGRILAIKGLPPRNSDVAYPALCANRAYRGSIRPFAIVWIARLVSSSILQEPASMEKSVTSVRRLRARHADKRWLPSWMRPRRLGPGAGEIQQSLARNVELLQVQKGRQGNLAALLILCQQGDRSYCPLSAASSPPGNFRSRAECRQTLIAALSRRPVIAESAPATRATSAGQG